MKKTENDYKLTNKQILQEAEIIPEESLEDISGGGSDFENAIKLQHCAACRATFMMNGHSSLANLAPRCLKCKNNPNKIR